MWLSILVGCIAVARAEPCRPTCYSDFATLKQYIEQVEPQTVDNTFIVCPNTVLEVDGSSLGIQFKATGSKYTLKCGSTGELRNNCVFQGGPRHLSPGNDALPDNKLVSITLKVYGFTFRGATKISVYVQRTSSGSFLFENCLWEDNLASGERAGAVQFQEHIVGNDLLFQNCYFVVSTSCAWPCRNQKPLDDHLTRFLFRVPLLVAQRRKSRSHLLSHVWLGHSRKCCEQLCVSREQVYG